MLQCEFLRSQIVHDDLIVIAGGEDFCLAAVVAEAKYVASVLSPHGHGLSDALYSLLDLPQQDSPVVSACRTAGNH